MIQLLAQTVSANAELAGFVAVALALVKALEKAWDHQAAKRAKRNGGDPLDILAKLLVAIQADLTGQKVIAARQTDLLVRTDRRLEAMERNQIRMMERAKAQSDQGNVA